MAVDTHADILRGTCGSSGNDHRLGANEAPPAIISVFLGDELTDISSRSPRARRPPPRRPPTSRSASTPCPTCPRTTPTATGPRRSRSPATSSSSGWSAPRSRSPGRTSRSTPPSPRRSTRSPTRLEKAKDKNAEILAIVKDAGNKHGRIIFNGNNYSEEWVAEAKKRGLPNVRNTVDALKAFATPKALALFAKYKVLSQRGDALALRDLPRAVRQAHQHRGPHRLADGAPPVPAGRDALHDRAGHLRQGRRRRRQGPEGPARRGRQARRRPRTRT